MKILNEMHQLTEYEPHVQLGGESFCKSLGTPFLCPLCLGDYVHIGEIEVVQGRTKTRISSDKTETTATDHSLSSRGSQVLLSFNGECGHSFVYVLSFHKGCTYMRLLGTYEEGDELKPFPELWRD